METKYLVVAIYDDNDSTLFQNIYRETSGNVEKIIIAAQEEFEKSPFRLESHDDAKKLSKLSVFEAYRIRGGHINLSRRMGNSLHFKKESKLKLREALQA